MSDSVWPQRWQPTRLLRPRDSPDKNTGAGCHFFLQCMKVKSEREIAQSCRTLCDPMDCSLPGSSAHGIFQARVLEWVAIAFSEFTCRTLKKCFSVINTTLLQIYFLLITLLVFLMEHLNVCQAYSKHSTYISSCIHMHTSSLVSCSMWFLLQFISNAY